MLYGGDLADDEGGQADNDHAGAQIDVRSLLILGQHRTGQGGQGIGQHQADGNGEAGVDGGGADHVRVVTGAQQLRIQGGTSGSLTF